MLKTSTTVAAFFLSGFMGLACSNSRVVGNVGDAALASGGQAGSTGQVCILCSAPGGAGGSSIAGTGGQCDAAPSCNPGDIPITSDEDCVTFPDPCYVNRQCGQVITCRHVVDGDVDAGGPNDDSGTAGQSGTGSSESLPWFFPICNPGDQQVASAVGLAPAYAEPIDLLGDCPADRECYSQSGIYGPILCMLSEGVHCDDPLSCDPGDAPAAVGEVDCEALCYKVHLCNQYLLCKSAADAGAHPVVCSGTYSDSISLGPPDTSPDAGDGITMSCCGDGIIEPGEECDFGDLNGVPLDTSSSPWVPNPEGLVWCDLNCNNPHFLCEPEARLGGLFCD